MATQAKAVVEKLKMRNMVKLPAVVIEEQTLASGSNLVLNYGKNYTCIVILPEGTKLNDRMVERINILVNEPLG